MLPLPLLVTGVSGVAGFHAFSALRRRFPGRVVGVRPRATASLTGDGVFGIDADDEVALAALFAQHRFGSVLAAGGNCALKSCELNPALAERDNVVGPAVVARLSRRFDARLVHLSSDLVFSGASGRGGYRESDVPDPVTVYGRTMAEGELAVSREHPGAMVARISLPMGPSFSRHAGAVDWIWSRFRAGRPATLYFDEVRTPTYVDDLTAAIAKLLATDAAGLYHLGAPRAATLHEIGGLVNRVGGFPRELLRGCMRVEAGPMPPRAGNVVMNSDRVANLLAEAPLRPWPSEDDWDAREAASEGGSYAEICRRLYRHPAGDSDVEAILATLPARRDGH